LHPGPPHRAAPGVTPQGGRAHRVPLLLPAAERPAQPARTRPPGRPRSHPRGGPPGPGGPRRARRRRVLDLLPGHEAAPGHRGGAPPGPRAADPRRAHQRPRPGGHPRDPHAPRRAWQGGQDGLRLQPPSRRGPAHVRPPPDDPQGARRLHGHGGGAALKPGGHPRPPRRRGPAPRARGPVQGRRLRGGGARRRRARPRPPRLGGRAQQGRHGRGGRAARASPAIRRPGGDGPHHDRGGEPVRRALASEWYKLWRRGMVLGILGSMAAVCVLAVILVFANAKAPGSAPPPGPGGGEQGLPTTEALAKDGFTRVFQFSGGLLGVISLVLFAQALGSEYREGTLKVLLSREPRRLVLLAGKLVALGAFLAVAILSAFAIQTLAALLMAGARGISTSAWDGLG